MWEQAVAGAVAGLSYGIAGWQKNAKQDEKTKFDWKELAKSAAICTAVGAIAGLTNQDFNLLLTGILGVGVNKGISLLIELFWK